MSLINTSLGCINETLLRKIIDFWISLYKNLHYKAFNRTLVFGLEYKNQGVSLKMPYRWVGLRKCYVLIMVPWGKTIMLQRHQRWHHSFSYILIILLFLRTIHCTQKIKLLNITFDFIKFPVTIKTNQSKL